MNAKFTLVFLIVLGLFLAALVSRNPALAWMAMPFLCYLGAGLLTAPGAVHLRAARVLSHERCEAGTPVTMTLTIENAGPAIARLRMVDPIGPRMQMIEGYAGEVLTLPAGGTAGLRYTFKASRGTYQWSEVRITASDYFCLFEQSLAVAAPAQVLVHPAQLPSGRARLHPPHTLRAAGPNLSRLAGSGIDFFGIREYHTGDSLRWVHWRLSARHPRQFFTKEFEREEMADIGILVDGSAANNIKNGEDELFEYSIQAAAVLSKSLLQMGNRLSLLVLGDRVARVFPGTGKRQLARILNTLAVCEVGEKISLEMLKYLPVRLFPSHSFIIVISPLRKQDCPSIARLRAEGYQVLLVSPDAVHFAARSARSTLAGSTDPEQFAVRSAPSTLAGSPDPVQYAVHSARSTLAGSTDPVQYAVHSARSTLAGSPDPVQYAVHSARSTLAVRAAQLERAALLWQIREMGVQVVDWPVEQPLLNRVRDARWRRL